MPLALTVETFGKMKAPKDVLFALKKDLKNTAKTPKGKKTIFLAAQGVSVGGVKTPLFVVTEKPKDWSTLFKTLKPAPVVIQGLCSIQVSADKKTTDIVLTKVTSGSTAVVAKLLTKALATDKQFKVVDGNAPVKPK